MPSSSAAVVKLCLSTTVVNTRICVRVSMRSLVDAR
jgi:hypothetical protein